MGFGSYDESEQENQELETGDDNQGVTVHNADHDGEVNFESELSTDDLVSRLGEMKDSEEE